jgi:hypothetical protein
MGFRRYSTYALQRCLLMPNLRSVLRVRKYVFQIRIRNPELRIRIQVANKLRFQLQFTVLKLTTFCRSLSKAG